MSVAPATWPEALDLLEREITAIEVALASGAAAVEVGDVSLPAHLGSLPADLRPEPGLEEAAGRLARPEAGDADLVGELAERGVDRRFELGLRDRDVQLDLVVFERFDGRVHGAGHLTRGSRAFRSRARRPPLTRSGASTPPRPGRTAATPGWSRDRR